MRGDTIQIYRCCMCPQSEPGSKQCPAGSPCRFVREYTDSRGWKYFVRSGIGGDTFKVFFQKPGKNPHDCAMFKWHDSFDEAQYDLNYEAKRRNWRDTLGMEFLSG